MTKYYSKTISLVILIAFIFTQAGLGAAMPASHAENLRKPQEGANANGGIEEALARADGGAAAWVNGAPDRAAGVKILAIVGDEVSARGQIQKLLNEGYQPLTGEPITMDNIKFYQLPDSWTQADIEREALGTHAVIFNVDGIALRKGLIGALRKLGLPFAEVKENKWREALDSV